MSFEESCYKYLCNNTSHDGSIKQYQYSQEIAWLQDNQVHCDIIAFHQHKWITIHDIWCCGAVSEVGHVMRKSFWPSRALRRVWNALASKCTGWMVPEEDRIKKE